MIKISLATKINVVLLAIFGICFAATGIIAERLLESEAREEVLQNARLLMDSSNAAASYTARQIVPLLANQLKYKFLPQSLPDYAATENLNVMRDNNPDYSFKEAMLNPTNPRDRASDWEAQIIARLHDHPNLSEIVGEREVSGGRALYIARPIVLKSRACLECHSQASGAPRNVLDVYGSANGFNWNLDEVLGAQFVSVPMSAPQDRAHKILKNFMLSMLLVFGLVFVALNVMMRLVVTRRLVKLSRAADEVSMGKLDGEAFDTSGRDELSALAESFQRMRSSLAKALSMLE